MMMLNRSLVINCGHHLKNKKQCLLQECKKRIHVVQQCLNYSIQPDFQTKSQKVAVKSHKISPLRICKWPDLKEGQEVEGFVVQQIREVPEFRLYAYRLLHSATGAQYVHIHRDDSNNAFSIGFRTTPNDSTGLPHILEHTTLCGSSQYPCRDPFFKMLNRSLATFMNAMTGPDYTMYPFATQNFQDYRNLMSVYLDAVFKPQLRESDFRQEGWRLEHENVTDPKTPIIIKGVVFNEMKGVFSENQSLFEQQLLNNILPSHTYRFVSGGDPLVIPNLTYEDLRAFHAKYYSPGNSRIYSYGNFPLIEHLRYINNSYLSKMKNMPPENGKHSFVPSEKRWTKPRRKHVACRPDPLAANPNKQSTIAVSQLCSDITNVQETFELQVLSQLLVRGPNAAFYKTLIEPNIGAGFCPVTGYDSQTKDTVFTVGLQGVSSSDFDKVLELYDKTLKSVVDHGFEKEHVDGVLHGIELNVKHQSADFGLGLLFGLMPLWNHDGDLVEALRVEKQVSQLRENMEKNPQYLQERVKMLIDNSHRLILTMSPEEDFDIKQTEAEQNILKAKVAALSHADLEKVFQQGVKLREEQERIEDVSCLPTLHMKDLKKEIDLTPLTEMEFNSIPVQICLQPTNGMTYWRAIVNTSELSDELKELVPLFCQVVTKMGTKSHSFRELDQLAQLKTGGLSVSSHIADDTMEHFSYEQGIMCASYCLDRNIKDMFNLWMEIFNEVNFGDLKRFETLVRMSAAQLVNGIVDMGHHYAISSAASVVSPSGRRKEIASGLSHVAKMKQIAQMSDMGPVLDKMKDIAKILLNKTHMRCALNFSPDNQDSILKQVEQFIESMPGTPHLPLVKTREPNFYLVKAPARGIHHIHQIPVNFAAKSVSTVYYCHSHFASLRVMARLLTSKYLHPHIREKGGAYGSGLSLSPSGVLNFYSYRDPNSTATFDIFDKASSWVTQNTFTDQDIEEAKLGVFQNVDAPIPPGSKGMNKFLHGIDDLLLQMHRAALMSITRKDILEVAEEYLGEKSQSKYARALVGPENPSLQDRKSENWRIAL